MFIDMRTSLSISLIHGRLTVIADSVPILLEHHYLHGSKDLGIVVNQKLNLERSGNSIHGTTFSSRKVMATTSGSHCRFRVLCRCSKLRMFLLCQLKCCWSPIVDKLKISIPSSKECLESVRSWMFYTFCHCGYLFLQNSM